MNEKGYKDEYIRKASDYYTKAVRLGRRKVALREERGEEPYLPALEKMVPGLNQLNRISLGVQMIDLDRIAGTVTAGRQNLFSEGFFPVLKEKTEFRLKWINLCASVLNEGVHDAIEVYEYYNQYYVLEGNKRTSVMRCLGVDCADAHVTRIIPENDGSEKYQLYMKYQNWTNDSGIYNMVCSRQKSYDQIYSIIGKYQGESWTEDEFLNFRSLYTNFSSAYQEMKKQYGQLEISEGDAFVVFLSDFGYKNALEMSLKEMKERVGQCWPEYRLYEKNHAMEFIDRPTEKKKSLITSIFESENLKCAFLYNSDPKKSGWLYWHELARMDLESNFEGRVTTSARLNVAAADADQAIEELIAEGNQVIFAASPVFAPACIRQSLIHPEVKILNCSLLTDATSVRSYYLRTYEAKFVLGILAGIMAKEDVVGYVADYPVNGTPAAINAFAMGVKMIRPDAKVLLDWSTIQDHDPVESLLSRGVSVISNRDMDAEKQGIHRFGLYRMNADKPVMLGMPIWNWYQFYLEVVQSILTKGWYEEGEYGGTGAFGYYMGMNTDAIDLIFSPAIPQPTIHLCEMIKKQIEGGQLHPFMDALIDQEGNERVEEGTIPTQAEIIQMDYLIENVIGELPDPEKLTITAQEMMKYKNS